LLERDCHIDDVARAVQGPDSPHRYLELSIRTAGKRLEMVCDEGHNAKYALLLTVDSLLICQIFGVSLWKLAVKRKRAHTRGMLYVD
jgi:hypothetical protein